MLRSFLPLLCLALAGCSPLFLQFNALPDEGGSRRFSVHTVYGGLDGNVSAARDLLDRESQRLCGTPYTRTREQDIERRTAWGVPNGQFDLIWEVRCAPKGA